VSEQRNAENEPSDAEATPAQASGARTLRRELGVFGATMMGLGAIFGTGVFVSIGVAAGIAGPAVVLAIVLAAGVATCNALSSAQLAANHPVSGGTYEYGYLRLHPAAGFTAGWMFLCAKSASAATAALGFAGYGLNALGADGSAPSVRVALAALTVALLTALVLGGMRRSSAANIVVVSVTIASLLAFVAAGLPLAVRDGAGNLTNFAGTAAADSPAPALLEATALMFVAYTGYGRIATLGEEVRRPRQTIPRAIGLTLVVSAALYSAVGLMAIAAVGSDTLGTGAQQRAAPLEIAASAFEVPGIRGIVAIGALTAMLGVLLNLILGLSRVLLAMGRRGDMPEAVSRLDARQTSPYAAVLVIGLVILSLTLIGDVRLTWSFSAFTVLIYYALTNGAALTLPSEQRLYPRWIAGLGLLACLFLAWWVPWRVWAAGLGLIGLGLLWHRGRAAARRRMAGS
jgi:APA family basic amino acid/polyamine antiporter